MITTLKTLTGAKIILETLKNLKVDTIFGYPGGMVLKLYDEIYLQNDIRHILVRHEQSAVHAAEGYARSTGKTGVVLVTSGPGATNTVSGIANAYLDGFPLVVLTGQVNADLIGKDAFQEANICDITKTCSKKVFQITEAKDIEKTIVEAFEVANSGKKGPVVIDLAKNIFYETVEFFGETIHKTELQSEDFDVCKILYEINSAKKPLVISGGGTIYCAKQLTEFINRFNIPLVTTMMGIGAYPQTDLNYLGMIGIFGDNCANQALRESDLIISLGARLNDRITCCFDKNASKIIQIDINKAEISRNFIPYMSVVSDCKTFLEKLLKFSEPVNHEWNFDYLKSLNKLRESKPNVLQSWEVMQELNKFIFDKDVVVTSEVGQHQLWASQNLRFNKPLKFLVSGGSGTMGFGIPAAIGSAIAGNEVFCVTGDGAFQMSIPELATCKDYNLPIKFLILNNGYLGMVRQLQQAQCEKRYSETKITNPDFMTLAKSYGIKSYRVTKREDILKTLQQTYSDDGTVVIEFVVEPIEVV